MWDLIEKGRAAAVDRWPTKTGLALAVVTVSSVLIAVFAGLNLAAISWVEWIVVGLVAAAVCGVWFFRRVPRVPKGKVGFGVAITFENDEQANLLRADLLVELRTLLQGSGLRHQFQFVELPQSVTRQLVDEDRARALAFRANIHFLVYGRARLRDGAHVIDLRGIVRHAAVTEVVSEQIRADFAKALPARYQFSAGFTLPTCEFAARHLDAVARYVIGTAAAASGDYAYAEELLKGAEARLNAYIKQMEAAPLSVLLDQVRKRLSELYSHLLDRWLDRYTLKRERDALVKSEDVIGKLRAYDSSSYAARLAAAMCAFVLRRDVATARSEIAACHGTEDATWRYGEAFLNAYDGQDLDAAYRSYSRAFSAPLENASVPTQSEEFIQIVLDEEPSRYWLHYCLGMINRQGKGDYAAATADLERFIGAADPARYSTQIAVAHKWIKEMKATSSG